MPFNLVSPSSLWVRTKRDTDGTSGDGTASNSATTLESFNPEIGLKADTAATTDSGTFSLIALIKRLLASKLPADLTASGNFKTAVSEALPAGSNAIGSVSVSASALPTGAATAANQSTANTSLSSIDGKLPTLATGRIPVDGSGVTQPISAASLPLPTDAATATNQATANTTLASIDTKTPALSSGRVPVDGSGVTQPISAASLPLPSGAATSANQSTANTSLASIDTKTPALTSGRVPVDGSGVTQPISVASLPLPSGAATAVNQSTANTSLSSIDGKLPALASGKVPSDASLRYTVTNRNGTTSGTPNTWSQLAAANSSRNALFIFNPASNTASIDVGFGGSGSEAVVFTIPPSGTFSASALNGIPTDRVAVRSTGTSVAYYAVEG